MINIENELTKQFLTDKTQEIKGYGNRKTILETADNIINKDADVIKQALIENIVRKAEIYNILYNQECTLHQIQEMCEDEKLNSKQQNNKSIGFKTNN